MKRRSPAIASFVFAAGLALSGAAAVSAEEDGDTYYVENIWNFVDDSIDADKGIPDGTAGALNRIRVNGVLRVAVDPVNAPYCYRDSGDTDEDSYSGADLELARLIAEKMGVELQVIPMDSLQLLPALTEEQCDLSISAISFTPSRALSYALSKSYYVPEEETQIGFVIREEDAGMYESVEDFAGKVIVAQSNSLSETVGAERITDYGEFRRVSSAKSVYESVQQKTADAGIVEINTANTYFLSYPDSGLSLAEGISFTPAEQYLGLRVAGKKGENQLLYFVNGVIDEVTGSGSYEEWLQEASEKAQESGL